MASNIPSTKGPNLANPPAEYDAGHNQVKESVDALNTLNWLGDN